MPDNIDLLDITDYCCVLSTYCDKHKISEPVYDIDNFSAKFLDKIYKLSKEEIHKIVPYTNGLYKELARMMYLELINKPRTHLFIVNRFLELIPEYPPEYLVYLLCVEDYSEYVDGPLDLTHTSALVDGPLDLTHTSALVDNTYTITNYDYVTPLVCLITEFKSKSIIKPIDKILLYPFPEEKELSIITKAINITIEDFSLNHKVPRSVIFINIDKLSKYMSELHLPNNYEVHQFTTYEEPSIDLYDTSNNDVKYPVEVYAPYIISIKLPKDNQDEFIEKYISANQ
jgi:hypothetical protein